MRDSEQLRLENVVVRLRPGDRYTTAESDGSFSFHNLPLGEYEVSIDPSELPGEVVILSKRTVPVSLFDGSEAPFVSFQLGVRRKKKRIRHIEIPCGWSVFGVQRLRRLVAAPGLAARPHLDAAKTMTGDAS